jgi:thiol-disulfide isomerase/thioredoxin
MRGMRAATSIPVGLALVLATALAACETSTTTPKPVPPASPPPPPPPIALEPLTGPDPSVPGDVPVESRVPRPVAAVPTSEAAPLPAPAHPGSAARLAGAPAALPPGAKAAGTSDKDPLFRSLEGRVAPELSTDGTWIREPLAAGRTLAALRGQVVYLQFAFVKCGACEFLTPHLRRWHESYGASGLVVLEVDNGLMDPLEPARAAFRERALPWAIFHDTNGSTIAAYGVRGFPTAYVLGKDGRVLWEGNPMGSEPAVEDAIKKALK